MGHSAAVEKERASADCAQHPAGSQQTWSDLKKANCTATLLWLLSSGL